MSLINQFYVILALVSLKFVVGYFIIKHFSYSDDIPYYPHRSGITLSKILLHLILILIVSFSFFIIFDLELNEHFKDYKKEQSQLVQDNPKKDIGIYQKFDFVNRKESDFILVKLHQGEKYVIKNNLVIGDLEEDTPYIRLSEFEIPKNKREKLTSNQKSYLKELKTLKKNKLANLLFGKKIKKEIEKNNRIGQYFYQVEALYSLTDKEREILTDTEKGIGDKSVIKGE